MAIEIELKCLIAEENRDKLIRQIENCELREQNVSTLVNAYCDTDDFALLNNQTALRIREKNSSFIQTLKAKGTSHAGLHSRTEWEWQLESGALDLTLLPEGVLPQNLGPLRAQFETNFERTHYLVSYQQSEIEVAIDSGVVKTDSNTLPISEFELELKSGNLEDLLVFAVSLAEITPFQVSDASKGDRGYFLLGKRALASPEALLTALAGSAEQSNPLRYALHAWIAGIDYFLLTGQGDYLPVAVSSLKALWPHLREESVQMALDHIGQDQLVRAFDDELGRLALLQQEFEASHAVDMTKHELTKGSAASALIALSAMFAMGTNVAPV